MTGQQLKLQGMSRAAVTHWRTLMNVQCIAKFVARNTPSKQITIEDVRKAYEMAKGPWNLGNAAGSVFAGPDWECVGYTTAKRAEAHGRVIRVWRLK